MSAPAPVRRYSRRRLDSLVGAIETAILSGDRQVQSQLVLDSADLLVKRWSCLAQPEKPAFDALLTGLAGQIDPEARRAFAIRLAALRRGPPRTSDGLARDPDGAVAAPLLEGCRSFEPAQLVAIATTCGEAHRRAIARRPAIGTELTDALLRSGSAGVAAELLGNPTASLSRAGMSALLRHAAEDEHIALTLAARSDLADADWTRLVSLARERARATLAAEINTGVPAIAALLERACARVAPPAPARLDRFDASVAFVASRLAGRRLTASSIERWLVLKRIEDVLAAVAQTAALPIGFVVAAYDCDRPIGLATILRGADWPWSLVKMLLEFRYRRAGILAAFRDGYVVWTEVSPLGARRLVRLSAAHVRASAFAGRLTAWPELAIAPTRSSPPNAA